MLSFLIAVDYVYFYRGIVSPKVGKGTLMTWGPTHSRTSFLSLASKLVNASSNGLVDMREQREETGGLRTCPQRIFLR